MKRTLVTLIASSTLLSVNISHARAQNAATVDKAVAMVKSLGEDHCRLLYENRDDDAFAPELHTFSHRDAYDDEARNYQLIRVPCWLAAYNQGDAYVLVDSYGEASLVAFAVPTYTVKYKDPDTSEKVSSIQVTGYGARFTVGLSHFDPETKQISEYLKSRGLGDASTSAIWQFENESFRLLSYSVDATYDGELNQKKLVGFGERK